MLVTMFNDLDHDNVASLQSAICLASILPFTQEFFDGAEPPPSTLFDCPFLFEGDLALKILLPFAFYTTRTQDHPSLTARRDSPKIPEIHAIVTGLGFGLLLYLENLISWTSTTDSHVLNVLPK